MVRLLIALSCLLFAAAPAAAQSGAVAALLAPQAAPAAPATAPATTPSAPPSPTPSQAPLTPAQAQAVLEVLRDDARRAQFVAVLDNIARALPAAPAAPEAKPPALPLPLAPDSLGAELLVGASDRLARLSLQIGDTARALTDFPLLIRWARHVAADPDAREDVIRTGWRLAIVLLAAVVAERVALLFTRRVVGRLAVRAPDTPPPGEPSRRRRAALLALRKLPYALARLLLDLLPLLAFAAMGYALLGTKLGAPSTTRLVELAVLNAWLVTRLVVTLTRAAVAPETARLRLPTLTDAQAAYIVRWVRRIAIVAIFGYTATEVALLFGLYRVAHDALLKLVSLAVHLALIVIVLQQRRAVARLIRPRADATGPFALLRRRSAATWHIVAIFYLAALWLVWAFEVPDGYALLVRMFVATVLVLAAARLLAAAAADTLERWLHVDAALAARYPGLEARVRRYAPLLRGTLRLAIAGLALVTLLQAWGLDSLAWFDTGALGGRVVSALITIAVTVLLAVAAWEVANALVQYHLARLSREAQAARAARLRTLLPMFRTSLMVLIVVVAGLVVLSEIGVNIAPLLAGAGVLGIAIGFGSQKLVQDVITGLFLLLENAMQVGDVVTLGGLNGSVEALSVRTIRLRALDGSVHIVPFSAVTTVTNMTKDYGYAVVDISVGLNEDPDNVAGLIRDVAEAMRAEPRWASAIRDDIEMMGVERFVDLAYVIRARVMTLPGQRWAVARELNQRIKARFDELAIESPITSSRVLGMPTMLVPTLPRREEAAGAA